MGHLSILLYILRLLVNAHQKETHSINYDITLQWRTMWALKNKIDLYELTWNGVKNICVNKKVQVVE